MAERLIGLASLDGRRGYAPGATIATFALIAALAVAKLGIAGLAVPGAIAAALLLIARPVAAIALTFGLAALCEGPTFGLLHFTSHLYDQVYKGLTPLDMLVAITLLALGVELIGRREKLIIPRPLAPGLVLLALAMIAGALVGHAAGASLRAVVLSENVLLYLLLLPIAVASLRADERRLRAALGWIAALAALKAVLGLIEIVGHYGASIEGTATLTYYEPAANWLIMISLLTICACVVKRMRMSIWLLASTPLLAASLLLSYRRSFWIAVVLGIALVFLLGSSVAGRRLLVPTGVLLAVAIWLLGTIHFQSQLPVVKRVESLNPSSLTTNVEDRYRIDERANVFGEIQRHPITGLGMTIPWEATVQPLSVEHENGRQYVHFAALWYWLKLGILGLCAYLALLAGAAVLAWRVWQRSRETLFKAFGLASLCGLAGLAVIETTASFTGVDLRFTVLLAVQIGLLALIDRRAAALTMSRPLPHGLLESSDSAAGE